MDGVLQSAVFALLNTAFYAMIIYGNISFLYPILYERNHRIGYITAVILLLVLIGALRGFLSWYIYIKFFSTHAEPFSYKIILNYTLAGILLYILSFIFRIALAYFKLKKENEVILLQKSNAELSLLKSQVQPHFLFNTLNNIYYEAFLEAPRTAHLIERLAEIMRYFIDDSLKEKVTLDAEVQFLESYITLEQIRVLHGVEIDFLKRYEHGLLIPPMLLITFVENVFKHGIDKAGTNNKLTIKLVQDNGFLHFTTMNTLLEQQQIIPGIGLKNLTQRLALLYQDTYELKITTADTTFTAYLKIPLL